MKFGGMFRDSLVVEQLDKLSVSFLVDELEIRRGGVAPNMCFGLGMLGVSPVLVGAAGDDFADYRSWLERHGVDCSSVRISETRHTARFVCTTDTSMAQFASFYPGAMAESRLIELKPIVDRVGSPTFVLISADDPEGMVRHTHECRQRGYAFIADPSQQLAFSDGALIRDLIDGAAYLFSNEYESHMIESKTGWTSQEVLDRVGVQVTTLG
jgi:adenosine kinase